MQPGCPRVHFAASYRGNQAYSWPGNRRASSMLHACAYARRLTSRILLSVVDQGIADCKLSESCRRTVRAHLQEKHISSNFYIGVEDILLGCFTLTTIPQHMDRQRCTYLANCLTLGMYIITPGFRDLGIYQCPFLISYHISLVGRYGGRWI